MCVRGEIRGGFLGREMVHASFALAGGALPGALTSMYSSLPQAYLRNAVLCGLNRADLGKTIPAHFLNENDLQSMWNLDSSLQFCTARRLTWR